MKRLYNNWLTRLLFFIGGIFSLRLVSTFMHMTTLDKLYKPRSFRKSSHLEISPEIVEKLPRYCQTIFGAKMDPINLMFVGTEAGIKRAFEKAGWHGVHPSSPVHVLLGFFSSLFNRTYNKGPFMPLFISVGLQDIGFQKVTKGYSQRHHIRVWRTKHQLPGDNRLWVAAATFEKSFKVGIRPPFIFHHMEPNLDIERDYIVEELIQQGHLLVNHYRLNDTITKRKPRKNPHGDRFYTDGMASAVEIV